MQSPITPAGAVGLKLRELEDDAGRYVLRLGARYCDVVERLAWYLAPASTPQEDGR